MKNHLFIFSLLAFSLIPMITQAAYGDVPSESSPLPPAGPGDPFYANPSGGSADPSMLNFPLPGPLGSASNDCANISNFQDLVKCATRSVINPLVTLLLGIALLYFLGGVVQYLRKLGSTEQAEAKQVLWWGIIALFVMVSVWGLVQILVGTFGFNNANLPNPNIPRF